MELEQTSLSDITSDQIRKAFIKTVKEMNPPVGKLVLVTEDLYQTALQIPKFSFYDEEPTGKSLNLQWSDDLEALWLGTLEANLSIMLVNEDKGEVIGIRAIKITKKTESYDSKNIKDEDLRRIVDFMSQGFDEFFEEYNIDETFHFLGLGVAKAYRRRGVGRFLMESALKFIDNLEIRPYHIKGEGTSNYSKRIYEQCGFDTVLESAFDDYKENGHVVFRNTGEHKSMKVYGKRVE